MELTNVHTWRRRRKEEGGGKRLAPNKAGPMRPPLLNGIKWECIRTIGTYFELDQGSYLEEEKDGPLIRLAL